MRASLPAIFIMIGGLCGLLPVDTRVAWALIFVAGLLMVI